MSERKSKWFSCKDASTMVDEPELKKIILKFQKIITNERN